MFVDQSPIGKTARSNPVSYVGAWDAIRKLFAVAPLSRQRGYTAAMFSFNSGDGRCPTCGGSGFEHVEMQFLSTSTCAARTATASAIAPRSWK
jgi:excinuclease ABC subunit A